MITLAGFQQDLATIEKKRRKAEPLTAAHAADEAEMDAECAGAGRCEDAPVPAGPASKAIADLGCTDPGAGTMSPHDMPDAGEFARPYLDAGHSAPSPQHQPPNPDPLPPQGRGILEPLRISADPVVAGSPGPMMATMAAHQARAAQSMPPVRGL